MTSKRKVKDTERESCGEAIVHLASNAMPQGFINIHIHMHVRRSVSKHMSTETGEQIRLPELLEHFDEFLSSYFFFWPGVERTWPRDL